MGSSHCRCVRFGIRGLLCESTVWFVQHSSFTAGTAASPRRGGTWPLWVKGLITPIERACAETHANLDPGCSCSHYIHTARTPMDLRSTVGLRQTDFGVEPRRIHRTTRHGWRNQASWLSMSLWWTQNPPSHRGGLLAKSTIKSD